MKFVKSYSKSKSSKWLNGILDENFFDSPFISNSVNLLNIYDDINKYYHKIHIYYKNKYYNLWYINKYLEINKSNIECLPFDTEYYVTQKINGKSLFVYSDNGKPIKFVKSKDIGKRLKYNFDKLKYKYLFNKYSDYVFEFKIYNDDIYLINIFHNNKILTYGQLVKINMECLDNTIKLPRLVNIDILKYGGLNALDLTYNDWYIDDNDVIFKKYYMITFMFKNNKYLFVKI